MTQADPGKIDIGKFSNKLRDELLNKVIVHRLKEAKLLIEKGTWKIIS